MGINGSNRKIRGFNEFIENIEMHNLPCLGRKYSLYG